MNIFITAHNFSYSFVTFLLETKCKFEIEVIRSLILLSNEPSVISPPLKCIIGILLKRLTNLVI